MLFGQPGLLFVFIIQTAMKCQATFCDDLIKKLNEEIREHWSRCLDEKNNSPCCEAEESSLKERARNYKKLCPTDQCYNDSQGLEYSILFEKTLHYREVTSEDAPWMKAITACFWVNQTEGDTAFFVSYTSPVRPAPAPGMEWSFKPIDLRSTFEVATAQYQLYFAINKILHYTPTSSEFGEYREYSKGNVTVNDGKWHAICCVWSSHNGLYRIYKDGILAFRKEGYAKNETIEGGGTWLLSEDRSFDTKQMIEGEMTEVNIWDKELSYEEIREFSKSCQSKLQGNVKSWNDFLAGVKGNVRTVPKSTCCNV